MQPAGRRPTPRPKRGPYEPVGHTSDAASSSTGRKRILAAVALLALVAVAIWAGVYYGGSSSSDDDDNAAATGTALPYVKPPVQAAAPAALAAGATVASSAAAATTAAASSGAVTVAAASSEAGSRVRLAALDPAEVVSRFFNPAGGPTELFVLLAGVDGRIGDINRRLSQFDACYGAEKNATAYVINGWSENVTMYAQCADVFSDTPNGVTGFVMFGRVNDTFYMYEYGGETAMASRVQLVTNATAPANATANSTNATVGDVDTVELWYSVGMLNTNGSHAVVHVLAEPRTRRFEMVAAGRGIGFCGAQLRGNNATINITGSAGPPCIATDSVCTTAANISATATCGADVNTFALTPLGMLAYASYNASYYPGGAANNVRLTVLGTDDDTYFGPVAPLAGVWTP